MADHERPQELQEPQELPALDLERVRRASVQEFREQPRFLFFQVALAADEAPVWWSPQRDRYLDQFWPTEAFLSGAIYSVASRNASFRWELTGPRREVEWAHKLLAQAEFGSWQKFITKLSLDLLTQDNGAFFEIVRPARAQLGKDILTAAKLPHPETGEPIWYAFHPAQQKWLSSYDAEFKVTDSPLDLPVGLLHLDSARCARTGDPSFPVVYSDLNGLQHRMAFWQIATLEDLPSPRQEMNGVGFSAVTRVLRSSQILRDLAKYKSEKISGRFARAVHFTNVDESAVSDAIAQAEANADSKGLAHYIQPIVVSTIVPTSKPEVATLELASIPDGFDEETTMRWYIASLALGLGVDYGFLAPLPGNRLGTATQAEAQERQARGKSSRLFMQMMANLINTAGILPQSVAFRFSVADPEEESERDRALARRTRARSTQISSGEISPEIARQIAADVGDLDPKYLVMLGEADLTPIVTVGSDEPFPKMRNHIEPGKVPSIPAPRPKRPAPPPGAPQNTEQEGE